jgi:Na+/H+ antiporter NhaD/arsenite permease-like protein
LVSPKSDPQTIFENVELSVLAFFAALFVIVGGLEHTGVLQELSQILVRGAGENLVFTALIILWASAVLSAVVDNIPFTVAMIPIIAYLETQGVAVDILWWALVFGVGFGGNGSPIGSTAGVIVVSKSEQTQSPISFLSWIRAGGIVTVCALTVASVALVTFQGWFID